MVIEVSKETNKQEQIFEQELRFHVKNIKHWVMPTEAGHEAVIMEEKGQKILDHYVQSWLKVDFSCMFEQS